MFKDYESKPIMRRAYQLKEGDVFDKVGEATYRITINGETLDFKAYEPVKPGDYIVYLNAKDIYHCNAKVFAERNIVE